MGDRVVGRQIPARPYIPRDRTLAMLRACLNCSGCCPQPSWPWARPRHDLVLENPLLCHQLAVLTRPTRTRPRVRLHTSDRLLWVLARRWCAGWQEDLAFVTPDTVVRWDRQGRGPFWRGCCPRAGARLGGWSRGP